MAERAQLVPFQPPVVVTTKITAPITGNDGVEVVPAEREARRQHINAVPYSYAQQRAKRIETRQALKVATADLKARISAMSAPDKEAYSNSISRLARLSKVVSRLPEVQARRDENRALLTQDNINGAWQYMTDNNEALTWLEGRNDTYMYETPEVQQQINKAGKTVALEFLRAAGMRDKILEGVVQANINVNNNDVLTISQLYNEMVSEYSFEGTPNNQAVGGVARRQRMAELVHEEIESYEDSGLWDSDGPLSPRDNRRANVGFASLEQHFMACPGERLTEYIPRLQAVSGDNYLLVHQETHVAIVGCLTRAIARQTAEAGREANQYNNFKEQENNVCRVYHFFRALHKGRGLVAPRALDVMRILRLLGGIKFSINHSRLHQKFQNVASQYLNGLTFDQARGDMDNHQYQSFFLITAKRFANGASAFCKIGCAGQLAMGLAAGSQVAGQVITKADDISRRISETEARAVGLIGGTDQFRMYLKSRISFWLLHTTMKGDTGAATFSGIKLGNALSVTRQAVEGAVVNADIAAI